jgi:hypothetical protein
MLHRLATLALFASEFDNCSGAPYYNSMGKMIDTAAAARKLGVNLQRIRALLAQRRIPGARLLGRQWFIPEDFEVTPGTRGPKLGK